MEIRHFITFKKIIECGSFTHAAEQLGYTQSTVTSHIQALEDHLGAPLFDRLGRKIRLTETGSRLLQYSQEMLKTYEKIENMANETGDIKGELRIAAPESLTVYRLEPILSEYRKQFPHVSIRLSNATCRTNKLALLTGDADIAFLILPELQESDLVVHSLAEEPIVVVGSPDHPITALDSRYHHRTLEECLIANERDCSYRTMFEEYLRDRHITPSHIMELWSIEAMKRCVASGLGFACLPLLAVMEELRDHKLRLIPFEGSLSKVFSQMIYHKNKWLSPALAAFIEITLRHAKDWSYEEFTGLKP
ncbi:LysR family transcriptional regulator [Paenibacillus elgii]|uniref:LysR family transcriptional regulator n=1 Tax=Paenibacillus elgii TaxID=189691 RepID=A0A2T6FVZ7_9BACL|nr:LysR family transcriptional regulator [Paenibacillus elgii]PUA36087.1 LysR family transcriptional regulator [Paenibacillus elgii]